MRTPRFRSLAAVAIAALVVALVSAVAQAQTDVAASLYGAFSGATSGNGTVQSPANQAGGMIELRHIANPLLGFEATYSFNRANETYRTQGVLCPAMDCGTVLESVSNNAHEITGDWVPSLHVANLRPFGVLGAGLLLDVPATSQATIFTRTCAACGVTTTASPTQTSTKPVFVYGAGLDWGLLPHIGLRLQYRGNLYSAPNVTKEFSSANTFLHTSEPMIGLYFRL